MIRVLRILHLEDEPTDARLIERVLTRAGMSFQARVVQSGPDFERELENGGTDVILSDFCLPGYDGLSALAAAQKCCPDIPFLFVSGRIGEEPAVSALKNGASDYLAKDRLARLPAAVERAVKEAEERKKRKEAETALREREEMFTAFMDLSPGMAFVKDTEGRLVWGNEALKRLFAAHNGEWRGKTDEDLFPPAYAKALRAHDEEVLQTGKPVQATEILPDPSGIQRHWLMCKFPLQRSDGQRLIGGVAIDTTEQEQLEQKFLRAQRMESLGILAGGIAHDLNNVLLPVLLGCEVLRDDLTSDANREVLGMIESSATRGSALVKQVLTFARGGSGQKLLIDPAHLVKDVAGLARRTLPAKIEVRCHAPSGIAAVQADPTQIHQVVLNLVVNARDAMPDGGTLTLTVRNIASSEVTDHFGAAGERGSYVLIEVSDTGLGIPEGAREHIFEPFFTTKNTGQGTGLGLATSLGIVKTHGGLIDFSTELGRGTTFSIYLPATAGIAGVASLAPSADLTGGAEVVLIIDDEVSVRELTKAVLGRYAYQVLTASNGVEGVSTFARFKDRIQAVLVDHKMPLMDGPQAVREIRKLNSKTAIIGLSGHALSTRDEFMAAGANAFLPKPFTAEQVLGMLKGMLIA